jgi:GNAT superfamily N-acetyltransferase
MDAAGNLLIRELSSADRPAIEFAFRHLGERSRYQRFFTAKPALTDRELDRLMGVDHWHHEALIAWSPIPRAPIAVARYVRGAESFDAAEAAIAVVDEWQHRGVGRALLHELSTRAVTAGVRRFTATLLWENRAALALVRELGRCTVRPGHAGVIEVVVELGIAARQQAA